MPEQSADVLNFWFGSPDDPGYRQQRAEWFRKDASFDEQIRRRFGALIDEALAGGLSDWAHDAHGALARVILLDQFTRNTFRDSARAFSGDALALAAAQSMVDKAQDRGLTGVQRQFVYLPFEHAEDLAAQQESMRLFEQLEHEEPALSGLLEWSRRHHDIVARFGRFPHRNAALCRASSEEESAFLRTPGSGF